MITLTRFQKILALGAVVFVVFYIGAIALTVQSRLKPDDQPPVITSDHGIEEERYLILPELLLPMGILLALSLSYYVVKRRNIRAYRRLDDEPMPVPGAPADEDHAEKNV